MAGLQEWIAPFVYSIEKRIDRLKYARRRNKPRRRPLEIQVYNGYGNEEELVLTGRVLEKRYIKPATEDDRVIVNLLNFIKRMDSKEIPFARLRGSFGDTVAETRADEEGMFEIRLRPDGGLVPGEWHEIELELISPEDRFSKAPVRSTGKAFVPHPEEGYIVISDIDDTVLKTNAFNILKMVRTVFLKNARTRLPFEGAAAFYRALNEGAREPNNPLFYVSSSPWNLYDLLYDFLEFQNFPSDMALFLRNWGITEDEILPSKTTRYKTEVINSIMSFYNKTPFILIGDSGQEDATIYALLAENFPDRILSIYIRDVTMGSRSSLQDKKRKKLQEAKRRAEAVGTDFIVAKTTVDMAAHAIERGWIKKSKLREIDIERHQDRGSPGTEKKEQPVQSS
ncbi:MAG: App1 family protein [Spirochaetia bacterium]